MCEECYMTFCPESCPGYESESRPIGRCEKCGCYIYSGDGHVAARGTLYCEECIEELDTDGILLICGFSAVFELLRELGIDTKKGDD